MGLFTKLNTLYINWYIKRQQEKKMTKEDKKRLAFANRMRELYGFVKWLDKEGFSNRHQRKAFWRNVMDGESVLEKTLENLIRIYGTPRKLKKGKPRKGILKGKEIPDNKIEEVNPKVQPTKLDINLKPKEEKEK